MKNSGTTTKTGRLRRVSVIAVQLALIGTLTACSETPFFGDSNSDDDISAEASAEASAEQTNNGINADGYVQVEASADTDAPDLGSAAPANPVIVVNPLAVVESPEEETEDESDESSEETETADTSSDTTDSADLEPLPVIAEANDTEADEESSDANETPVDGTEVAAVEMDELDEIDAWDEADASDPDAAPETETSSEPSDAVVEPDTSSDTYPGDPAEAKSETATFFTSHTTPGFTGEVIDDSIHVTWNADPGAIGYNVYRQAEYVTTVWENTYIETDLFDKDYYYEIQAFDETKTIYYYVATGLTVSVRSTGKIDPTMPVANPDRLKDYELIFADEFNGDSLDTSKWNTSFLWGDDIIINGEVQHYVDINNEPDFGFNPFTFDGESLTINSIKTPSELSEKANGLPYLSGLITSYDALQFIYGYAETRAKVSFGRGYWPAFWLLNAYYGQGGDDPEIDIMEFIGHDQDVVYHTYHYYDADGKLRSTESQPTPGVDYTAGFHTYGVEWKPGTIIYYVDGIEVHRVTDPKVSQQTMYVIANTALGGWWAGDPDESTPFPGEYKLDYIRVYQKTTPYDDELLLNDGVTDVPYADDIPGQAIPNHRPTPEQWPEGYPHR